MTTMKTILPVLALTISLFLTSCGGSHTHGTHTHDDGSVHEDHAIADSVVAPGQESFKVEADSITPVEVHDHEHDHGDGKTHTH